MNGKPKDYDDVKAYGEFRVLPAGAYPCKLIKVQERNNKWGRKMVVAAIEIVDGDYAGYFLHLLNENRQNADNPADVKYPNNGVAYINVEEKESGRTTRAFKSFCVALEESGAHISWDENFARSITNASVGVIFRREQDAYNGRTYWKTRPYGFISMDKLAQGDYTVPADKPLADGYNDEPFPTDYSEAGFQATDDDIPW